MINQRGLSPPQPDRGKSETEISSGQINCSAWGPAKCRVNPGEHNGSLVIWLNVSGISVDGQRLLPAPSWPGLAFVPLCWSRAHSMRWARTYRIWKCTRLALSPQGAASAAPIAQVWPARGAHPGNSSSSIASIAGAECIPMKRTS